METLSADNPKSWRFPAFGAALCIAGMLFVRWSAPEFVKGQNDPYGLLRALTYLGLLFGSGAFCGTAIATALKWRPLEFAIIGIFVVPLIYFFTLFVIHSAGP